MNSEILVIDDNPDIRFLICNILKEKNFQVRSAANYNQALNEIDKKLPDLTVACPDIIITGIDLFNLIIFFNKSIPSLLG